MNAIEDPAASCREVARDCGSSFRPQILRSMVTGSDFNAA